MPLCVHHLLYGQAIHVVLGQDRLASSHIIEQDLTNCNVEPIPSCQAGDLAGGLWSSPHTLTQSSTPTHFLCLRSQASTLPSTLPDSTKEGEGMMEIQLRVSLSLARKLSL